MATIIHSGSSYNLKATPTMKGWTVVFETKSGTELGRMTGIKAMTAPEAFRRFRETQYFRHVSS